MPKNRGAELRADVDGVLYSESEFLSYYGPDIGPGLWRAASGRLPVGAPPDEADDGDAPAPKAPTAEEEQIRDALADLPGALRKFRPSRHHAATDWEQVRQACEDSRFTTLEGLLDFAATNVERQGARRRHAFDSRLGSPRMTWENEMRQQRGCPRTDVPTGPIVSPETAAEIGALVRDTRHRAYTRFLSRLSSTTDVLQRFVQWFFADYGQRMDPGLYRKDECDEHGVPTEMKRLICHMETTSCGREIECTIYARPQCLDADVINSLRRTIVGKFDRPAPVQAGWMELKHPTCRYMPTEFVGWAIGKRGTTLYGACERFKLKRGDVRLERLGGLCGLYRLVAKIRAVCTFSDSQKDAVCIAIFAPYLQKQYEDEM